MIGGVVLILARLTDDAYYDAGDTSGNEKHNDILYNVGLSNQINQNAQIVQNLFLYATLPMAILFRYHSSVCLAICFTRLYEDEVSRFESMLRGEASHAKLSHPTGLRQLSGHHHSYGHNVLASQISSSYNLSTPSEAYPRHLSTWTASHYPLQSQIARSFKRQRSASITVMTSSRILKEAEVEHQPPITIAKHSRRDGLKEQDEGLSKKAKFRVRIAKAKGKQTLHKHANSLGAAGRRGTMQNLQLAQLRINSGQLAHQMMQAKRQMVSIQLARAAMLTAEMRMDKTIESQNHTNTNQHTYNRSPKIDSGRLREIPQVKRRTHRLLQMLPSKDDKTMYEKYKVNVVSIDKESSLESMNESNDTRDWADLGVIKNKDESEVSRAKR
ncbi:unnamed protein product, partial [Protopolystoma xenopodis]